MKEEAVQQNRILLQNQKKENELLHMVTLNLELRQVQIGPARMTRAGHEKSVFY